VVLEASGGLETGLAAELVAAGLPAAVVNPRQVRDFARASGQLAKTDTLDARMLARFGERMRPQLRKLPDQQERALKALVVRRRQLVEMMVAEQNRLDRAPEVLHPQLRRHIEWLRKQVGSIDRDLDYELRNSSLWREKETLLRSVPGIGPVVCSTLIAGLPELGTLSRRQICRLSRCRAAQSRQRNPARPADGMGWPQPNSYRVVHGHPRRRALQSCT